MKHILIVDDEHDIRELLLECLSQLGYRADALPDGRSALDWLKNHGTDMILLDIKMPGLSGIEVLEEVQQRRPEIPVIVLSGCGDEAIAREALRKGAHDFLPKPIGLAALEVRLLFGLSMNETLHVGAQGDGPS